VRESLGRVKGADKPHKRFAAVALWDPAHETRARTFLVDLVVELGARAFR
jgi:hypothetical protein